MKSYERVEVYLEEFLMSAVDGGKYSSSRSGCFTRSERLRYPLIDGCVWMLWIKLSSE
jgi:hypothetical protein